MLSELSNFRLMTMLSLCLNPCFNGICSLSDMVKGPRADFDGVLILVLMEYAL